MYASDITRTFPATESSPPANGRSTTSSWERSRLPSRRFKSGKSHLRRDHAESLHKVAYDYINTHGKDLHGEPLGKYFIHGSVTTSAWKCTIPATTTSHSRPEWCSPSSPASTFRKKSWESRIEDTYYVDASGKLISLTAALPHTAEEVEHAMAGK